MAARDDRNPAVDELPDPVAALPDPPQEEFWERYNRRLEFPLSTVAAVLVHVLVAAVLIYVLAQLMHEGPDKSSVPVKLIDVQGGEDDAGMGSAGSGQVADPLKAGEADPWKENLKVLPDPSQLPEVIQNIKEAFKLEDPTSDVPVSEANAPAYTLLDKALRDKMLNVGANKGSGGGTGKGNDGTAGAGPGGVGADSSRNRSLRWVLRFRTANGDDYVAQLAAMGAVILVPIPPANDKCIYFTDIKNPSNRRTASDADLKSLANQIKFSDTRPESVRGVCRALGVREEARSFWAFFPKGFEDDLARKETNYRNRRAEDIEETVYRVIVRGGTFEIVVDDQTPKR